MSAPSSYTEKSLAEFMQRSLGKVAKALNLTAGPNGANDFQEAVDDCLILYGSEDVATVSGPDNIAKLRALARVAAWRYVVTNFSVLYDFSADGGSYNRSQLFKNAKDMLALVESQAVVYETPVYAVEVHSARYKHDPYATLPIDEVGE